MKKKVLTMALLIINAITLNAQTTSLSLYVHDAVFNRPLANVHIQILSPDSVFVDTCKMIRVDMGVRKTYLYVCDFPNNNPYFLLKLSKKGFDTEIVRVESARRVTPPPVLLRKTPIQLDSAIVRASKIMMVMHGDTIVYNADVFELSEGSMLDALIEQLPGVNLLPGGVITVNGNPVSRLLIDGKDFFQGNPAVALENLPAYTVSKVKAYQKAPDNAYLTRRDGEKHPDDPWVIDVNLKKEYHEGWIANAEIGGGTSERYLGKAFGLYFNDRFRFGAYANLNNLNDNRRAGQNGDWQAGKPILGKQEQQRGGVFFLTVSKDDRMQFRTTVEAFRTRTNSESAMTSTNILTTGSIHGRAYNNTSSVDKGLSWYGSICHAGKKVFLTYDQHLDYASIQHSSSVLNATFQAEPFERYRLAALDSIFFHSGYSMKPYLTNYYRDIRTDRTHHVNFMGAINATIELPWDKSLTLFFVGSYNNTKSHVFSDYMLHTPHNMPALTYYNRLQRRPQKKNILNFMADYCLFESENSNNRVFLNYDGNYQYSNSDNFLYRLDRLNNGWDLQGVHPYGSLPSTEDSLFLALDWSNSYTRKEVRWHHKPKVRLFMQGQDLTLDFSLHFPIERASLNDMRLSKTHVNKKLFHCSPLLDLHYKQYSFYGKYERKLPDLHLFLDILDDSNPLAMFFGNPSLKASNIFHFRGKWEMSKKKNAQNANVAIEYYLEQNAVGQSRRYNEMTGAYLYKPENIDGNWQVELRGGYARNFDKNNHWSFSADGKVHYNHSVDFEWMNKTDVLQKSIVNNYQTEATLSLRYRSKPLNAGLKTVFDWQHATSRRANFQTINSFNILYALSLQAKLPWDIDVNSDFTLYTRNGYEDETMNTNEWVWNMSVEKRLLRNKSLTLKFTGFDILAQRSNIMRTLNAQGRTETWYNTIPRYFLFSIAWRFHKAPRQN